MSAQLEAERAGLPVEMLINGKKVLAPPGRTVLEVVEAQGLDRIPTLCHDPRLEPYGSCFLCVVEVKGAPRLLPACVTRVRDGMEVTTRSERIVRARKTALELLLSDHYADCVCPASLACPAGVDVQGYLSLARLGFYREALAVIKQRNPLPVVCGRVCVRKCEVKCLRSHVDEPVGINMVKRFVSGHAAGASAPAVARGKGKNVAVVGSGPAGLTCAYYLALKAHHVTIFEARPRLGGMLRYGIPQYRLPRAELDAEIQEILDLGVQVETTQVLGRDFTLDSLLGRGRFEAVFLALGAPLGKKLGLEGEDKLNGICSALDFLRDVEIHGPLPLSGSVVVIGGGNSAIDAARTSLRCGARDVAILYRRTRREMPAHPEEVDAAEKEGVRLEFLRAPVEILSESGRIRGIRCLRVALGEPDASGRRKPVPIEGSEHDILCDHIFAAIGQDTDLRPLHDEMGRVHLRVNRAANLEVDPSTMTTSVHGVFAGGDVVSGPAAVIDAIAHGRRAAESIDRYLSTGEMKRPQPNFESRRESLAPLPEWLFDSIERSRRGTMPERDPGRRIQDFLQVETGLTEPQMKLEAGRCMECGCRAVFECDLRHYAAEYGVDMTRFKGDVRRHRVDRSHPLIILDPNKCILCGRCLRRCSESVGLAILGFVGRGFQTEVRPALGRPMAGSNCIACGACVESCPTGALEARLPYGRQGPWLSRKISSICNFCSAGCEIDLNVVSDGLLWATAPETSPPGGGELCLKGRFGTGLIHGADRLRNPLLRQNGNLVEAGWEEAIEAAARALGRQVNKTGPQSMAVLAAARMTLEEAMLVRHLAAAALGGCEAGSFGAYRRGGPRHDLDDILGETASTCMREDIDRAALILLAGADPSATHPALAMDIRRAVGRGAVIVSVNSSPVDLLRPEDLWLDARRGTAGILLAAILNIILEAEAPAGAALRGPALQELRCSIAGLSVEKAAGISGVGAAKIEALARMMIGSGKVVALYDLEDTLERAAGDLQALAQILILTGHIGKEGEGLLLLRPDCNSEGARLAGIANTIHPERIRGALAIFENPLGDRRAAAELRGIESLVVIDHFLTETAQAAEVVLPAATLAESDGTVVRFDGKLAKLRRAVSPRAGLATADILVKLSQALGHPVQGAALTKIRATVAAALRIPEADLERAREAGTALPRRPARAAGLRGLRLDSAAMNANMHHYASLDAILDKKLLELGLAK